MPLQKLQHIGRCILRIEITAIQGAKMFLAPGDKSSPQGRGTPAKSVILQVIANLWVGEDIPRSGASVPDDEPAQ